MVLLSKAAPLFLSPLSLAILLLAAGILLWRRPRLARALCVAALLVLAMFGLTPVSRALLSSLEDQDPDIGSHPAAPAQAIVVLGGAVHAPHSRHGASALINPSDRLLHALRLYRAGSATLILCSGGNNPLFSAPDEAPEAQVMSGVLQEWGVPSEAILVEGRSVNTRENAAFSYQMLQPRGIRRILLVSSALHMPRAAAVFRKAGFEVFPAPADFRTGWGEPPTVLKWVPAASELMWVGSGLEGVARVMGVSLAGMGLARSL